MKHQKTILIIGGGIAGLATGCYARMNGYESLVFEMGERSGGVCTSWDREGYTINGCIHWLVGSSPDMALHQIWQELGIVKDREFFDHDRYITFETRGGKTLSFFTQADRLEAHLMEYSPDDMEVISELADAVRTFAKYDMPLPDPRPLSRLVQGAKMVFTELPLLRIMLKWMPVTIGEFAQRFKHPDLKEMMENFWDTDMSMATLIMTLAFAHAKSAGYPLGGSLPVSQAMTRRYEALGGEIAYKSHVDRILVKDGKAVGVLLADGREYHGDYVVSTADLQYTLKHLLRDAYWNDTFKGYFKNLKPFKGLVYVSMGLDDPMADVPQATAGISFPLDKPLRLGAEEIDRIKLRVYNYDPHLAPEGKTLVTFFLESGFDHWHDLYQHQDQYQAEKQRLIQELSQALIKRFPRLEGKIEMVDVSTPVTFHNYTGNYRGSYEGWLPTPEAYRTRMKKTLPGLEGLLLAGHWVAPGGGLPAVALSGRTLLQRICHQDHREFVTAWEGRLNI